MSRQHQDLISNEEYVHRGGDVCPKCRGGNIESDTDNTDGAENWCHCFDCRFVWLNVYQLVGWQPYI